MDDITQVELTSAQHNELESLVRTAPAALARRARIILARARGDSLGDVASGLRMHRDSVRRWVVRFRQRGVEGLQHGNLGKPKNVVFDAAIREEICRRAACSPHDLGERFDTWSLYKLRDHLMRTGVVHTISVESLRLLLKPGAEARRYWARRSQPLAPLDPAVRRELLATLRHAPPSQAQRARAVLALAEGASMGEVARTLHVGKNSLRRWLTHFRLAGPAGLFCEAAAALRPPDAAPFSAPEDPRDATPPFGADRRTRLVESR
jgi:transposase